MTDRELQDLIGLKKYEQPEEGYFDDFLLEFQQRQRSEMLQTSARGLLVERIKAWFGEIGTRRFIPWVAGAGLAYALVAFVLSSSLSTQDSIPVEFAEEGSKLEKFSNQDLGYFLTVSMEYTEPVDFTAPKPVFSTEETYF